MKFFSAIVVCMFSFTGNAFARNVNVCALIADLFSQQQSRFEQASFALKSADAICGDDSSPLKCNEVLKSEYLAAKTALETAQKTFQATCGE